ncbi:uncharacterized protein LOC106671337 [Cimex lectularius]|uniref:Uncharacterized protein n=1 Tax=Cimex lectularius TaxID=79782 RepID=A0A8I6TJX9_CIMLE|nr:uncharacterized protein LOC106671337 [Cimex lectularius]
MAVDLTSECDNISDMEPKNSRIPGDEPLVINRVFCPPTPGQIPKWQPMETESAVHEESNVPTLDTSSLSDLVKYYKGVDLYYLPASTQGEKATYEEESACSYMSENSLDEPPCKKAKFE